MNVNKRIFNPPPLALFLTKMFLSLKQWMNLHCVKYRNFINFPGSKIFCNWSFHRFSRKKHKVLEPPHLYLLSFILCKNQFWYYSQACSNDHLYMMATQQPMLSRPKQIPIQSLLYKMITCLTRPAITFLSPKWKKTLSFKQSLQNFTQWRNWKKT